MFHYMISGGYFMWPIFFLSVLALWVTLEKIAYFVFVQSDANTKFKMHLSKLIAHGDSDEIRIYVKDYNNSIARMSEFILDNTDFSRDGKAEFEYVAYEAVSIELVKLEKRNWILGLCASVSPQLGLLGTVVGMIKSFLGLASVSNAHLVAAGISESLYTTAAGLLVAIPSLVAHLAVNKKIDSMLNDLNRFSSLFSRSYQRRFCETCPA